jgi:hypothetical protein
LQREVAAETRAAAESQKQGQRGQTGAARSGVAAASVGWLGSMKAPPLRKKERALATVARKKSGLVQQHSLSQRKRLHLNEQAAAAAFCLLSTCDFFFFFFFAFCAELQPV